MKFYKSLMVATLLLSIAGCSNKLDGYVEIGNNQYPDAHVIVLDGHKATMDGEAIEVFDYTWHCDPFVVHDEVKDAPAEYYTGEKPVTNEAVYVDQELYYYPKLDVDGFKLINYDGEREWAYYYKDGENEEYIFGTLPYLNNQIPVDMMHTEEEAAENKVLHITQAGTYVLEGVWNGQIRVDLGDKDETFSNENAKVKVILNGVDITCSVAPGIVFYSAYECDNTWEERDVYSDSIDTTNAGVTLVVGDDSENTITGKNIFRMLKTKYKDETMSTQKKMRKNDGALYSYVSMNIEGEDKGNGSLVVNSGFEGIDSELHLSINGGNIVVNSQDDGMNVNEDHVSVILFKGGSVEINAALGAEGDGVDSNGFIVIDGGNVSVNGIRVPDSALDSEDGIYYYGGNVIIDGEEQVYEAGSMFRETGRMFGGPGMMTDFDIAEFKQKVADLDEDASWEEVMEIFGRGMNGHRMQDAEDMRRPEDTPENEKPEKMPWGEKPEGEKLDVHQDSSMFNLDINELKEKVAALDEDANWEDVMKLIGFGRPEGEPR